MDKIGTYGVWYPTSKLDAPALATNAGRFIRGVLRSVARSVLRNPATG